MIINTEALQKEMKAGNIEGVEGFNRLMGAVTGEIVETLLNGELTSFLGYEKYAHQGDKSIGESGKVESGKSPKNSRNGFGFKKVKTNFGELNVSVPRDRHGEFSPLIVPKGDKDITGMEEKVISMYARGMSTRDISSHVNELYNYSLSADSVSHITEQVLSRAKEWQSRPLDPVYAIVFLDGLSVKMRWDGHVRNVTVYNILGITLEGQKECLGLWVGQSESSKFWLGVLNELKNRGVQDILIFSVDNLTGFSEAITASFPDSEIQKCIVHQIRNSTKYVSYKERAALSADLKQIYKAATEEQGFCALGDLENKWGEKYPHVISSWHSNWSELSTFFKYPAELRRLIYTTNPIESMNRGLRKVTKTKGLFPHKDSVLKLLYLAVERMSKKWTSRLKDWSKIYPQLLIYFGERIEKYL